MIHWPLLRTQAAKRLEFGKYGPISEVHTFGEIFQILDILKGRKDVPAEIRTLAHMSSELAQCQEAENFSDLDLVLLGPSSPVELTFRGFAVNRFAINREVRAALEDDRGEAEKLLVTWSRVGLIGLNESVRRETAEKLVQHVQGDSERAELARAVIRETHPFLGDVLGGFRKLREIISCPIGVILYIFRYMPDGRALSWPAGFRGEVVESAQSLGLPLFDPSPMVVQHGVKAAMAAGLGHYSQEFLPIAGKAIAEFGESLFEQHKARQRSKENSHSTDAAS